MNRSSRTKKILAMLMAVSLVAMSSFSTIAEAKRMGGSRSFGRQAPSAVPRQPSPVAPQQAPAQRQAAQQPATPAPQQPARNRWLGPLAGLAAGLGIAALLSHFGLGEAFASGLANMLLIALAIFAVIWLIRKFRGQPPAPATSHLATAGVAPGLADENRPMAREAVFGQSHPVQDMASGAFGGASVPPVDLQKDPAALQLPAGFDAPAFLQSAKQVYVRMQAAYDEANLKVLRELTNDEVLAELQREIDERGGQPNVTEVVTLNAELVGFEIDSYEELAAVHFSGMVREAVGQAAQPFEEIWNLTRPVKGGGGWVLSGMQAL
ncbi:MAG: Tim44 domain-containing protein [Burkholderiaceae bacterium]